MSISARAASRPKTRKARTVGAVQASRNFVITRTDDDSLIHLQAQRLAQRFGLAATRARTIAMLAWGAGEHG